MTRILILRQYLSGKGALRPTNGQKKENKMHNELDRIPPGLWAPIPIPAIKFLANNGHRQASRVLYAIGLHKGSSKTAIFPSYETIAFYASVGENSIRECLNVLEKFGFIKVTKTRVGKKNQNNRYQILDKAYSLEINPKAKITKIQEPMICNSCWDDVEAPNIQVSHFENWEGQREVRFKHIGCQQKNNTEELIPITETSRRSQQWQRSILERAKLN